MRLPLVLATLFFAISTKGQNFSSYVPECAPPCVEQTLNSTKLCAGLDDSKCLCTNFSQITFSSRICFVQTCNANIEELRSEIISGWQKFCNDSGTPINSSTDWNQVPGSFPTSSALTSSATPSMSPTSSPTASNDTIPMTASGLSTGAKAGIGVGAGVGSLLLIGGLVSLGFRLGRQKNRESKNDAGNTPPFNDGTHPEHGQSETLSNTTNWPTAEGGGDVWADKRQPALAELPAHDVRELPTNEHPVELWHGEMPTELSADSGNTSGGDHGESMKCLK
ncbi:hypothetical protein F4823DRAFT_371053 [Ustulina deusta]|nr:hypothetical protein F4823DRAFT_371053 [Ustulina deusta]